LGHRRVAHISYAPLIYLPARVRFRGYRTALQKAGIRFDKRLFAEGNFTCESGYHAMKQTLASCVAPTALFAGNDTLAIGAMTAVREAGLSIPDEFAVVGYDDIPSAAFACPPLTTIRSHAFDQGKLLAEAVIDLVEGKKIGKNQSVIPLELVIRKSCGAGTVRRGTARAVAHGAITESLRNANMSNSRRISSAGSAGSAGRERTGMGPETRR